MKPIFYLTIITIVLLTMSYSNKDNNTKTVEIKNVLGDTLQTCCTNPMTGFYRNGKCETGTEDYGTHVVCAEMTDAFLEFTLALGNDLITPRPEYRFPGLKAGDKWCLCALRWREAEKYGFAPPVVLESTHKKALEFVGMETLKKYEKK